MGREIRFEMDGIRFSWDENKAKANWRKHKVAFEAAVWAFLDPNLVDLRDSMHDQDEQRRNIIAAIPSMMKLVFVIYVERIDDKEEEIIRIISARKAARKEKEIYERGLSR